MSAEAGGGVLTGRVPDFFIVGHYKSGTTAMYRMLRAHPQIFMPEMKEPEFFGRDLARRRQRAASSNRRTPTYAESRPQTYSEYLALFAAARPDQRVGEASPSYLALPAAASAIAAVQPTARIIAILREPASFLYSLHLQMLRNHVQSEPDLRKAMSREQPDRSGAGASEYLDRVRYVEQLRRYHEAFSPEQVLVLIYDDFRADNEAAVRRVLRFLDVDADRPIPPVRANPIARRALAGARPLVALGEGRRRAARARGEGRRSRRSCPTGHGAAPSTPSSASSSYTGAEPPDPQLMRELRARFKPEVASLSDYLGRDLVGLWGYDDLD